MNKNIISLDDARSLISKLISERVRVLAFFVAPNGISVTLPGGVDSLSKQNGLIISVASPPSSKTGYLRIPTFDRPVESTYSEVREMPEGLRDACKDAYGESVLAIRFLDTEEQLALFFTL